MFKTSSFARKGFFVIVILYLQYIVHISAEDTAETASEECEVITGFVELDPLESTVGGIVTVQFRSLSGNVIERAPVRPSGDFAFHKAPSQANGVYTAEVIGAMVSEYHPFLVQLKEGKVAGVIKRKTPLLVSPPEQSKYWTKRGTNLNFSSAGKTNYERKPRPWRFKDIWRYKYRIIQLLGVLFVLWFPKVIRDLPQDMREELMGEKEDDLGDTNALIKALTGRAKSTQEGAATTQK